MDKKLFAKIGGSIIVVISFVFIIYTISKMDIQSVYSRITPFWILFIVIAAVIYSLVNVDLAFCWYFLLTIYNKSDFGHRNRIMAVYLETQIAKYLPSNLVHFAGRHIVVRELGGTDHALLLSNLSEIMMLVVTSGCFVAIGTVTGLFQIPDGYRAIVNTRNLLILCGAGVVAVVGVLIFLKPANLLKILKDIFSGNHLHKFPLLLLLYLVFLTITGCILAMIFVTLFGMPIHIRDMSTIIFGYALAWVSGYVIPGAPGGLGVREAVLLLVLAPLYGQSDVLTAALVLRMITIIGDVASYLYGLGLKRVAVKN